MKITKIHLKDFRCFSDFTMELDPKYNVHVILAENMAGKSALLRGVNVFFGFITQDPKVLPQNIKTFNSLIENNYRVIGFDRARETKKEYYCTYYLTGTKLFELHSPITLKYKDQYLTVPENTISGGLSNDIDKILNDFKKNINDSIGSNHKINTIINPLFLGLTPNFIASNTKSSLSESVVLNTELGYLDIFSSFNRVDFIVKRYSDLFTLNEEDTNEQEILLRDIPNITTKLFVEILIEIFKNCETKLIQIKVKTILLKRTYTEGIINESKKLILLFLFETNGHKEFFELTDLSDGYKYIICLIGELIFRSVILNKHNPENINERITGVVTIDEFGIHMHPELQQHVLITLSKYFPEVQFIITTHSPLLVTGLKKEQIHILEVDEDGNRTVRHPDVETTVGLGYEGILKTMFGVYNTLDEEAKIMYRDYIDLARRQDDLSEAEITKFAELSNKVKDFRSKHTYVLGVEDPLVEIIKELLNDKETYKSAISFSKQQEEEQVKTLLEKLNLV